ncbi:MAG: DUF4962 domain-containing protein [Candidatus Hydrogenedentes bacterium]|nr:DUF4962 domain-containing protein [Candidatus Hydrogenedentota bacterium]
MKGANGHVVVGLLGLLTFGIANADRPTSWRTGHPRLFFDSEELFKLRAARTEPVYADIWRNIADSAEWCLRKTPRAEWIAPIADDPNYENLYDRFYAMMMDMAITEHLAFAYALSGDDRYGDAARAWTLACCRAWKPDADAAPDGGKAYAVMRLLKGVAVGYDLTYERFTAEERAEIVAMLSATGANYFERYFTTPAISGPDFHTHHAIVEWSSFGIAALALLDEAPAARQWLNATITKFCDHLLPNGLAPDGAQIEGATFWASTMHYRIFFMDALRRVTGRDLFDEFADVMNANLALASIAGEKRAGWDKPHETIILSPSYGQVNYYAPILLALAGEYKNTHLQYLAMWDKTLGSIQETRYITPNRKEQLLFELGGYAYCWYAPGVKPEPSNVPLSYRFPSVFQAYARESWQPRGIVAAIDRSGQVIVHAGGTAVLIAPSLSNENKSVPEVEDDDGTALLRWREGEGIGVVVSLQRPGSVRIEWIGLPDQWSFWCLEAPVFSDGTLTWRDAVRMHAIDGTISGVAPDGHQPVHAVGNGKLQLVNPEPERYPLISVTPGAGGAFRVEISRLN